MKLQGAKTFLEKRAKFYNKTFEEVLSYIYEEGIKKVYQLLENYKQLKHFIWVLA